MTEQKTNVITIDGKEYNQEDLSQDQNYFINQIKDLQAKGASLRFQLDQVTVAQNAFTNSLIQSVKGSEENDDETKQADRIDRDGPYRVRRTRRPGNYPSPCTARATTARSPSRRRRPSRSSAEESSAMMPPWYPRPSAEIASARSGRSAGT